MWTYLRRFHSDEDGAIALMFALFLVVLVGNWDPDQRIFTPEGSLTVDMALDAVRIDAYRSVRSGNDNPLKLFLAPVVGLAETSIVVRAIAWNEGGDNPPEDCFQNGIISGGLVDMDSNNDYIEEMCVYGKLGVSAQSDNCFY